MEQGVLQRWKEVRSTKRLIYVRREMNTIVTEVRVKRTNKKVILYDIMHKSGESTCRIQILLDFSL